MISIADLITYVIHSNFLDFNKKFIKQIYNEFKDLFKLVKFKVGI